MYNILLTSSRYIRTACMYIYIAGEDHLWISCMVRNENVIVREEKSLFSYTRISEFWTVSLCRLVWFFFARRWKASNRERTDVCATNNVKIYIQRVRIQEARDVTGEILINRDHHCRWNTAHAHIFASVWKENSGIVNFFFFSSWFTNYEKRTYQPKHPLKLTAMENRFPIPYRQIYLLTAIGLTPGGNSTVHIYTQTIHRTTQLIWEESGRVSSLRVIHWNLPYNWGKSTEKPQSG